MAILPEGELTPEVGTPESEEYLWRFKGVTLELTHNYGSETDAEFKVNNGNVEPYRGFGHIAVMTPDVYAASAELETAGVRFQKRPDEGRMKGIAFALCPDGYWIEIVSRAPSSLVKLKYTLAQTMIRVKDPNPAIRFYRDMLGMTLLRQAHLSDFSLYFLASLSPEEKEQWAALCTTHQQAQGSVEAAAVDITTTPEASEFIRTIFSPVLELTHNHGTESNPDFKYHNGNDQDEGQVRGFGHVGFLCDDLDRACEDLLQQGVKFKKLPSDGAMRGLAFAYQPDDNYWIELIQRGMKI